MCSFALVNVARLQGIEPEQALQAANDKFQRRFHYIEKKIEAAGSKFQDFDLESLDEIWEEAKSRGVCKHVSQGKRLTSFTLKKKD